MKSSIQKYEKLNEQMPKPHEPNSRNQKFSVVALQFPDVPRSYPAALDHIFQNFFSNTSAICWNPNFL